MERAAAFTSNHCVKSSLYQQRTGAILNCTPPSLQLAKGALLQWRLSRVQVFLHGCPRPCQSLPYLLTLHSYLVWPGIMFWATLCLNSRLPLSRKELSCFVCWLPLIPCWWCKSSSGSVMLSPPGGPVIRANMYPSAALSKKLPVWLKFLAESIVLGYRYLIAIGGLDF